MARARSSARRYAEAAFAIALRDDRVGAWQAALDGVARLFSEERVAALLVDPSIPEVAREAVLAVGLAAPAGPLDAASLLERARRPEALEPPAAAEGPFNLVRLLLRRGRLELLPRVAAEFTRLRLAHEGVTLATATSAAPLEPAEVRALTARLEQLTGGRVELSQQVDPGLLGGLVVRLGDRLIDGSVRGRLERLRNQLVSGAL